MAETSAKNKKPIDELTGFQVLENFQKFDQRNDIYCRSQWDPEVQSDKATAFFRGYFMPEARSRKTDGFTQRDYALRNAAWHVTNILRDIAEDEGGDDEADHGRRFLGGVYLEGIQGCAGGHQRPDHRHVCPVLYRPGADHLLTLR